MINNQEKTPLQVKTNSTIVPIVSIFIIGALGFVGYQVFNLMLTQDVGQLDLSENSNGSDGLTGNVFKDMATSHPKVEALRRNSIRSLQQSYNAVPYPHNISLGNPDAKARLTIFTDIACGVCRQEVSRLLQDVPLSKTHVVFKHAPLNEENIKSGLFEQMAERAGILPAFHQIIEAEGGNVSDKFMMLTLNQLGVSYKQQQADLIAEPGEITANLNKDFAQGSRAGIDKIPTFFLNRYRMSPKTLPTERIAEYIKTLNAGESLRAVSLQ